MMRIAFLCRLAVLWALLGAKAFSAQQSLYAELAPFGGDGFYPVAQDIVCSLEESDGLKQLSCGVELELTARASYRCPDHSDRCELVERHSDDPEGDALFPAELRISIEEISGLTSPRGWRSVLPRWRPQPWQDGLRIDYGVVGVQGTSRSFGSGEAERNARNAAWRDCYSSYSYQRTDKVQLRGAGRRYTTFDVDGRPLEAFYGYFYCLGPMF